MTYKEISLGSGAIPRWSGRSALPGGGCRGRPRLGLGAVPRGPAVEDLGVDEPALWRESPLGRGAPAEDRLPPPAARRHGPGAQGTSGAAKPVALLRAGALRSRCRGGKGSRCRRHLRQGTGPRGRRRQVTPFIIQPLRSLRATLPYKASAFFNPRLSLSLSLFVGMSE
jgi:hypothetical protein